MARKKKYYFDRYHKECPFCGKTRREGKITDFASMSGNPEESGRAFYMEPRPFMLPTEANSVLLSQMTKERFKAMLTGRFDSIDLATRIESLKQHLADVRILNDQLGWGGEDPVADDNSEGGTNE